MATETIQGASEMDELIFTRDGHEITFSRNSFGDVVHEWNDTDRTCTDTVVETRQSFVWPIIDTMQLRS